MVRSSRGWGKRGKLVRFVGILLGCAVILGAGVLIWANQVVSRAGKERICSLEEAKSYGADAILVLGAGVREDGSPSLMLRDRLDEAATLYRAGAAPKILASGDHGTTEYDEVNVMRRYLLEAGIPEEDIFLDHAGFSTYESMLRAKEVFLAKRLLVVTQRYHLSRALYIGEKIGLSAAGVPAADISYRGNALRNAREVLARCKDVITVWLNSPPKYLGEVIPLTGDGRVTWDQQ